MSRFVIAVFICTLVSFAPSESQAGSFPTLSLPSETVADPFVRTIFAHFPDQGRPGGSLRDIIGSLPARLAKFQQEMNRTLSTVLREVREHPGGRFFWLFLLLSGAYGVVHALGPGHGKTLVASYLLGSRQKLGYLHGLAISMVAATAHVASGAILVLVCRALLLPLSGSLDVTGRMLSQVGGGALLIAGVVIAFRAVLTLRRPAAVSDNPCAGLTPAASKQSLRAGVGIALASGMVPCPVAAMVLAFALATGLPLVGGLAMLAMAAGMGLTTWLFAVLAIACREGIGKLCVSTRANTVSNGLSLLSGMLLFVFGAMMMWS